MFVLMLVIFCIDRVNGCCPSCECHRPCRAPSITASIRPDGLQIECPNNMCGCVKDELDSCTYGGTWFDNTTVLWSDGRWHECIKVLHSAPLQASTIIRWWDNTAKCMGHSILNIDVHLLSVHKDVLVEFEQTMLHLHDETINNTFYVRATSGCSDPRPVVGQSEMFFQVEMEPPQYGANLKITNCSVLTTMGTCNIASPDCVLTTTPITMDGIGGIRGYFSHSQTRLSYIAYWDEDSNSPYHNIQCMYGIFNGSHVSERSYMIANPNEHGILWHET